ncbi:hypothetical protein TNCV_2665511 [Trichonephila clavipes]|nr:hypothetical protein TNCV_2665511 [Trichonephila clavipes]
MATGSSLTHNYSRSQSEIQGDLHTMVMIACLTFDSTLKGFDRSWAAASVNFGDSRNNSSWIMICIMISKLAVCFPCFLNFLSSCERWPAASGSESIDNCP